MKKAVYIMIWLAISLLAGVMGSLFFKLDFLDASLVMGLALIVNGLIAEWEDR